MGGLNIVPGATFVTGTTPVAQLRFSPDGRRLSTVLEDGTIGLWDVSDGTVLATYGSRHSGNEAAGPRFEMIGNVAALIAPQPSMAFSGDGRSIATATRFGGLQLWVDGVEAALLQPPRAEDVTGVLFSPDDRLLATGDKSGHVMLWHPSTGELWLSFSGAPQRRVDGPRARAPWIRHLTFTPDGSRLAFEEQSVAGTIQVWSLRAHGATVTASWSGAVTESDHAVFGAAFAPDGKVLAVADRVRRAICLYDPETLSLVGSLSISDDLVVAMAFSPSGRFLAGAGGAGTVSIWDVRSGRQVAEFASHTDVWDWREGAPTWAIGGIDWSQSGAMMATAGMQPIATGPDHPAYGPVEWTIKLWNVDHGG